MKGEAEFEWICIKEQFGGSAFTMSIKSKILHRNAAAKSEMGSRVPDMLT